MKEKRNWILFLDLQDRQLVFRFKSPELAEKAAEVYRRWGWHAVVVRSKPIGKRQPRLILRKEV